MCLLDCTVLFIVRTSHAPKPSPDVRKRPKASLNDKPGQGGKPSLLLLPLPLQSVNVFSPKAAQLKHKLSSKAIHVAAAINLHAVSLSGLLEPVEEGSEFAQLLTEGLAMFFPSLSLSLSAK